MVNIIKYYTYRKVAYGSEDTLYETYVKTARPHLRLGEGALFRCKDESARMIFLPGAIEVVYRKTVIGKGVYKSAKVGEMTQIGRRSKVVVLKPLPTRLKMLDGSELWQEFIDQVKMHHRWKKGDARGYLAPAPLVCLGGSKPRAVMLRADETLMEWFDRMVRVTVWERKERLKWAREALEHCLRVCKAIQFLHEEHQTAHSDIKLENVFLYEGKATLADLPYAKSPYFDGDIGQYHRFLRSVYSHFRWFLSDARTYALVLEFLAVIDKVKEAKSISECTGLMEELVETHCGK